MTNIIKENHSASLNSARRKAEFLTGPITKKKYLSKMKPAVTKTDFYTLEN